MFCIGFAYAYTYMSVICCVLYPPQDRLSANTSKSREQAELLADARRSSIQEAAHYIFPIEVQELEDDVESSTGEVYCVVYVCVCVCTDR